MANALWSCGVVAVALQLYSVAVVASQLCGTTADVTWPYSTMVDTLHDGRCITVMWCGGSHAMVAWRDGERTCGMAATMWRLCGMMVVTHRPCRMAVVAPRSWWGCGGGCIVSRWLHGMVVAGSRMA